MPRTLAIYFGFHDSNVALSDGERVRLHLEAERVLRRKHARVDSPEEMDELVAVGLGHLGWSIADIDRILLARWNNRYTGDERGRITVLGRRFLPQMTSHHRNHLATALPADFPRCLVLCADGGSEDGVGAIYLRRGEDVDLVEDLSDTPYTGRFFGTLTQILMTPECSRAHNFDAGKTMGLAAWGRPDPALFQLLDEHAHAMNDLYFDGCEELRAAFGLNGIVERPWQDRRRRDLAYCGQEYWIQGLVDRLVGYAGLAPNLVIVGGCGLNVVLNGRLRETGAFERVYVPPVPNDSGQSLGALLDDQPGLCCEYPYLGRGFGQANTLPPELVDDLLARRIVAWYEGRSESGPRALGHRSFIGLPDQPAMRRRLSEQIKGREPYRPVAPMVAASAMESLFGAATPSPYMSFVYPAASWTRDCAPAVIHADGTARVQTVEPEVVGVLAQALEALSDRGHPPILMNTSFNLAGEPIVDTPEDALRTFAASGADVLYLNGERHVR